MHPRAWFGLAVRVIGVWWLVQSASAFVYAFNLQKGLDGIHGLSPMAEVNQGVGHFVVGLLLVKLAPMVVGWAYPKRAEADAQATDEVPAEGDDG